MEGYRSTYCGNLARKLKLRHLEECKYFPKYFTIETCNNCNARCIMCPKGAGGEGIRNLQLMEDEVFDKILNELSRYNDWIEMICLNSDGEPLLDKKIALRIKKLKDIGIKRVNISTNGQLLTREKIRAGLNYDIVKRNVLNLIEMRNNANSDLEIRIRMVELEENIQEREAWLNFWQEKVGRTDKVQLMPMHTWSGKITEEKSENILCR